jgi:hypothetical protein
VEGREWQPERGGRGAGACEPCLFFLLVGPIKEGRDDLQDLKFLRIRAVESEEVEKVVGYYLSMDLSVLDQVKNDGRMGMEHWT